MTKRNEDMIKIVRDMRRRKMTYRKIAELLKKDLKSIWRWANYKLKK